jgi:putative two-component system response regulator
MTAEGGGGSSLGSKQDLHAQLLRYAADLQTSVCRERDTHKQLSAIVEQLEMYTVDLRRAVAAERRRSDQLAEAHLDTILRLARASTFRDNETQAHASRLGLYSGVLAEALQMPERERQVLVTVAPMHDIGKIGVPDAILHKAGPLTPEEWSVMRRHPAIGASLLRGSSSDLIETARLVSLTHHEAWDGSGYPQGLRENETPICGRIVKFVDVYDALRSKRPYKPALSHEDTCQILLKGDGRTLPSEFDPRILDVFGDVQERFDEIYRQNRDE